MCALLTVLGAFAAGLGSGCGDAESPSASSSPSSPSSPSSSPPSSSSSAAPTHPAGGNGNHPAFGLYILALTWTPSFCCSHPDKAECHQLAGSFGASHLTLHGLWPNYTDDEAQGRNPAWPEFCGTYTRCKSGHDPSCEPGSAAVPIEMRELGPGYVGDHAFLATHEWPKHGSCTGLTPAAYFRAALDAMTSLPGKGTPDRLRDAIGTDIALSDLTHAFGIPAASVLLACDARCGLQQVSVCFAHDAAGKPTTPISCPTNASSSRSDNGCVTRRCERVRVTANDACETGRRPDRRSHDDRRKDGVHACNRPGQGPSCGSDADCGQAGYQRCARSGCCTNQPR